MGKHTYKARNRRESTESARIDRNLRNYLLGFTHDQLDNRVREICQVLGLLHYHTYDSRKSEPGFPDWCIAGNGSIYYVENKAGRDTLSVDQRKWFFALDRQPHVYCWVVRAHTIDVLDTVLLNHVNPRNADRVQAIARLNAFTARELAGTKAVLE